MQEFLKKIRDAHWFQNGVTIVILLAGVLVGVETYQQFAERHHTILNFFDQIIIWIFVAEVLIKMGAEGKKPWRYFFDSWNVFDFLIVAACFMPVDAQYVMVLRLARLLRVLKLVRALPKLQILVGALLKSIPSMAYVSLLLFMLFYVYAVAATFMFGANDPVHFRSLPIAMLSLFRAVTLEDWTDLMYINQYGCDQYGYEGTQYASLCTAPEAFAYGAPFIFVTLVLLGTMIVLNLFIGVIMTGMDAAHEENEMMEAEERRKAGVVNTVPEDLDELLSKMQKMQDEIRAIKHNALLNQKR